MSPIKIFTIIGTVVLALTAVASSYKIKEGDTLSGVLFQSNLGPLYGKNGFVNKTISLNKSMIKGDGSFIRIGDTIQIPDGEEGFIHSITKSVEVAKPITTQTQNEVVEQAQINEKKSLPELSLPASLHRYPSDEYPYSYFKFSPYFSFLKIDSTNRTNLGGSEVILLSNKGVGVDGSWNIAYDEKRTYFGFASVEYFSLYTDPNYTFNHSSITRFHFGVGASFQCFPDFELTTKASLRNIGFLDVTNPQTINVASIITPELEVGMKKKVAAKKSFEANIGGHISGLLPSSVGSFHSKFGFGAGALVELKHKDKSMELTYDYRSLKINNVKNNESTIALMMNFTLGKNYD
jgi:hypothetical protein